MRHLVKVLLVFITLVLLSLSTRGAAEELWPEAFELGEEVWIPYDQVSREADDPSQIEFYGLPDFLTVESEDFLITGTADNSGIYTVSIETEVDGSLKTYTKQIYIADSVWVHRSANSSYSGKFAESETHVLHVAWDGEVQRSTDGLSWASLSNVGASATRGLAYHLGAFVVVSGGGELLYSEDEGVTWTAAKIPEVSWFGSVQVLNGEFLAIGYELHREISILMRSVNGIDWTSETITEGRITALSWIRDSYYINTTPGGLYTSSDMSEWSPLQIDGIEGARVFVETPDGQPLIFDVRNQIWQLTDESEWELAQTNRLGWGSAFQVENQLYWAGSDTLSVSGNGIDWSLVDTSDGDLDNVYFSSRLGLFFRSDEAGLFSSSGDWLPPLVTDEYGFEYSSVTVELDADFEYQLSSHQVVNRYHALGLPEGLEFDDASGLISGTVAESGYSHDVVVVAENDNGLGPASILTIYVSSNTVEEPDAVPAFREFSAFEVDALVPQLVDFKLSEMLGEASMVLTGIDSLWETPDLRFSLPVGVHSGTITATNSFGAVDLSMKLVSTLREWRSIEAFSYNFERARINYGDGRFYSTFRNTYFLSSDDGINWDRRGVPYYMREVDDVTGFNDYAYLVDRLGFVYRSQGFQEWELIQDGWTGGAAYAPNWIRNVGDRLFVTIYSLKELRTTSDGVNWEVIDTGVIDFFTDIAYVDGLYVLVGQEHILTSEDGLTWDLLYDADQGLSLGHLQFSSSVCVWQDGFVISLGEEEVFHLNASDLTLTGISHDGFMVNGPWAVVARGDALYAQDALGNELESLDGINWTMLTIEPAAANYWEHYGTHVFAAEGLELWNAGSMRWPQIYQSTDLPQLYVQDTHVVGNVGEHVDWVLPLSDGAEVVSINGLPEGLSWDGDLNRIVGTYSEPSFDSVIVTLENSAGTNYFLLNFEVLPALPVVTVLDRIVPISDSGAYIPLLIESSTPYSVRWELIDSQYNYFSQSTLFDDPYDITRISNLGSNQQGPYRAKVTNEGGAVYSDSVQLVYQKSYETWSDENGPLEESKYEREPGWAQTNLERYAMGVSSPASEQLPVIQEDGQAHYFEFCVSQFARDLEIYVQYSTDLLEWNGDGELTIEQVDEDLEKVYYRARVTDPPESAAVFYRLEIHYAPPSSGGSSSSGSSSSGSVVSRTLEN